MSSLCKLSVQQPYLRAKQPALAQNSGRSCHISRLFVGIQLHCISIKVLINHQGQAMLALVEYVYAIKVLQVSKLDAVQCTNALAI
jgi:hypothetical protein